MKAASTLIQRPVEMKPVFGYEGRYSITRDGRVWSHGVMANQYGPQRRKPHWKSRHLSNSGYLFVQLRNENGTDKGLFIHHLVLLAWGTPRPSPKHECNHKNGIKTDNHISNLEWLAREQHIRHGVVNGLYPRGSRAPHAKLTEADVIEIRTRFANGETRKDLAKAYGIAYGAMWHICARTQWRHI